MVVNKEAYLEKWRKDTESDDVLRKVTDKRFIDIFDAAEPMKEFDGEIWSRLGVMIMVNTDNRIIVTFLDGTEIGCQYFIGSLYL